MSSPFQLFYKAAWQTKAGFSAVLMLFSPLAYMHLVVLAVQHRSAYQPRIVAELRQDQLGRLLAGAGIALALHGLFQRAHQCFPCPGNAAPPGKGRRGPGN